MANAAQHGTVWVHREPVEIEPEDGWRRYKPGPKMRIDVTCGRVDEAAERTIGATGLQEVSVIGRDFSRDFAVSKRFIRLTPEAQIEESDDGETWTPAAVKPGA